MEELNPIRDVLGPGLRLLLVGINPGVRSSREGAHFAHPGNRFWPALHAAGITPRRLSAAEQTELIPLGVGITNLVARPSALASEVTADELRAGARRLVRLVEQHRPRVVAVLGVTAYRTAFSLPKATTGPQPEQRAGARWWVLHNPSGLNAHAKPADHAAGLRAAAAAAGLVPPGPAGRRPVPQ
jgi:double-stranded uracil-DNA glycosylase